eukprot:jgi/Astpho2/1476/fgenesh1_pg.00026_%23_8_t
MAAKDATPSFQTPAGGRASSGGSAAAEAVTPQLWRTNTLAVAGGFRADLGPASARAGASSSINAATSIASDFRAGMPVIPGQQGPAAEAAALPQAGGHSRHSKGMAEDLESVGSPPNTNTPMRTLSQALVEQHQQVSQYQEAQQGVHGGPAEVGTDGVAMQQQAQALEAALRGSQAVVQHNLLAAEEGMATLLARLRGSGQAAQEQQQAAAEQLSLAQCQLHEAREGHAAEVRQAAAQRQAMQQQQDELQQQLHNMLHRHEAELRALQAAGEAASDEAQRLQRQLDQERASQETAHKTWQQALSHQHAAEVGELQAQLHESVALLSEAEEQLRMRDDELTALQESLPAHDGSPSDLLGSQPHSPGSTLEQQCLEASQADGAAEQSEEQQAGQGRLAVESGVQTEEAAPGSGMEELCSCCELLRAQLKGDRLSRAAEVQQLEDGLKRQHRAELADTQAQLQAKSDRLCQELQRAQAELADSREACSQAEAAAARSMQLEGETRLQLAEAERAVLEAVLKASETQSLLSAEQQDRTSSETLAQELAARQQADLQALQDQLAAGRQEGGQLQASLHDLRQDLHAAQAQLQSSEEALAVQQAALQAAHQRAAELGLECEQLRRELQGAEERHRRHSAEAALVAQQLAASQADAALLREQLQESSEHQLQQQAELLRLQRELDDSSQQQQRSEEEQRALHGQLAEAHAAAQAGQAHFEEAARQAQSSRQELQTLQRELAAAQGEVECLQGQLQAASSQEHLLQTQLQDLEQQVAGSQQQAAELQEQLQAAGEQRGSHEAESQVLLQQVRELQGQLQEAREQQSTHEAESQVLLQQLAGQAERTQQLEGQAQQAEAVQSELQTGLEMTGARLCLVLAAWMCTVAAKHKCAAGPGGLGPQPSCQAGRLAPMSRPIGASQTGRASNSAGRQQKQVTGRHRTVAAASSPAPSLGSRSAESASGASTSSRGQSKAPARRLAAALAADSKMVVRRSAGSGSRAANTQATSSGKARALKSRLSGSGASPVPWQDTRIQEAAAELPVGFPAPLGGGHRAPQGQQELQPGGEGAPTPNAIAQGLQAARSEWMASQGAAVEEPVNGKGDWWDWQTCTPWLQRRYFVRTLQGTSTKGSPSVDAAGGSVGSTACTGLVTILVALFTSLSRSGGTSES